MIRHKSSLIFITPPKKGIGPGTVSGLTGLTPCFCSSTDPSVMSRNSVSSPA